LRVLPKDKKQGRSWPCHLQERAAGAEGRDQAPHRRSDQYVSLDQLCLSPQCGFASTEEGNVLAEEEQWAKLRMIVELADEVWAK
jgi:5-methyltetrahydropteroyltriglutamate--homocysteine methyltransferase